MRIKPTQRLVLLSLPVVYHRLRITLQSAARSMAKFWPRVEINGRSSADFGGTAYNISFSGYVGLVSLTFVIVGSPSLVSQEYGDFELLEHVDERTWPMKRFWLGHVVFPGFLCNGIRNFGNLVWLLRFSLQVVLWRNNSIFTVHPWRYISNFAFYFSSTRRALELLSIHRRNTRHS